MEVLSLAAHYGGQVDVDLCGPCHLVWFDRTESMRLAGVGLLDLLARMAALQSAVHRPPSPRQVCPVCGNELHTVQNRSKYGRSVQHNCPQGHGTAQPFSQFLAEKGYVRPIELADGGRLPAQPDGTLACVNCGAPVPMHPPTIQSGVACGHCDTPVNLLDLARLARAIDRHGAAGEVLPEHATSASRLSLPCVHCGASVEPTRDTRCGHCGGAIVVTSLVQASQVLERLRPGVAQRHERLDPLAGSPERQRIRHMPEADEPAPVEGRSEMGLLTRLAEVLVALGAVAYFAYLWFGPVLAGVAGLLAAGVALAWWLRQHP